MARFVHTLRDIGLGLRAQPGRTALAFLSIALGSLALAVLVAVLAGLADRSARMLREFGGSVIVLTPAAAAPADGAAPALTVRTADVLARNDPETLVSAVRRQTASAPGSGAPVTVLATDARLARVRGWPLREGRFLDEQDLRGRERHAVLSAGLAQAWNARPGQSIRLDDTLFRVVGIVECGAATLADRAEGPILDPGERVVFVPLTAAPPGPAGPDDGLDALFVRLPAGAPFEAGRARLARLLGDPGLTGAAIAWITPETLLRGVRRLQRALDLGVGGITLLGLTLGGITLAGLLAGNVRERIAEIGLRRALGATRGGIAALFLIEGGGIAVAAALAGVAAAHGAARLLAAAPEVPLIVDARMALIPVGLAAGLGLLASYLPARRAARIPPAEALRAE